MRKTTDFPIHVDLETTNICNLDCVHCGRPLMGDKTGILDWSIFVKVLKELEKENCPSLKLNWRGEPLIHPLLPEMIEVAKKRAKIVEVQINTNAQLLTKQKSKRLAQAGLDRIIISADGITKQTYEKIRINASWEKLIENLSFLVCLPNRPKIRIQTCEMPQNASEIPRFLDFWKPYADEVVIHTSFDPMKRKDPLLKRKIKKQCPQLWQRLVVAWNGDIHPCCVDWASKGILGNIKNTTLKEVWHSAQERYLRFCHKNNIAGIAEPCKYCDNYLV